MVDSSCVFSPPFPLLPSSITRQFVYRRFSYPLYDSPHQKACTATEMYSRSLLSLKMNIRMRLLQAWTSDLDTKLCSTAARSTTKTFTRTFVDFEALNLWLQRGLLDLFCFSTIQVASIPFSTLHEKVCFSFCPMTTGVCM